MKAIRLVDLSSGTTYSNRCTIEHARNVLRTAREALYLQGIELTGVVDIKHVDAIATVARAIHEIELHMPQIKCWCVVKHYASHDRDPSDAWDPSVWCGFTTEEQARAFAPVIAAHYIKRYPHHTPDRFEPEISTCRIGEIIHPYLTPEEYIATLQS